MTQMNCRIMPYITYTNVMIDNTTKHYMPKIRLETQPNITFQRYDWKHNQTLHIPTLGLEPPSNIHTNVTNGNATKHYIPTLSLEPLSNIHTNAMIGTTIKQTYQRYDWKRNQTLHTNVMIGTTIKHTYQRYDWNHKQTLHTNFLRL